LKLVDGDQEFDMPVLASRILVDMLAQIGKGNAVSMATYGPELSCEEAAHFLNVTQSHFRILLERKELSYRRVGSRRRIAFKDSVEYQRRSRVECKKVLDELARQSQELGLGY
jgi:excisionase family DNA binding protein